jgi:predicted alpha/beta hydrolase family esterase
MKTAIIIHGAPGEGECFDSNAPSASNHHWIPWLQKQLCIRGYAAHTPEIPLCWQPQYEIWRREFERYDISDESILVGHSCGGGFITRWMSEHRDVMVDKVVLVAPWLDPWRTRTSDFFEFELDPELAHRTRNGFAVLNSDNDGQDIQDSAYRIRDTVRDCYFREFHHYGHFCLEDLHKVEFPELLELLDS